MHVVRVLVVDDQALFRRAITAVVGEADGFAVVAEAATGEGAVDAVRMLRPDLVVMDVNLPGIDGVEATRRVRATAHPPVVLLISTYDDELGAGFVAESGAAAYLTKSLLGPASLAAAWAASIPDPPAA